MFISTYFFWPSVSVLNKNVIEFLYFLETYPKAVNAVESLQFHLLFTLIKFSCSHHRLILSVFVILGGSCYLQRLTSGDPNQSEVMLLNH